MDIRLYNSESTRLTADHDGDNFVDVTSMSSDGDMSVGLYTLNNQYIEIRKKDNKLQLFKFKSKASKKYINFGYWQDAEVVFSFNPTGKDAT